MSSLFDYANTDHDGLVWNTLCTIEPSISATPKIWTGFVKPAWPLFDEDVLVKGNAVFGGVVTDRWAGEVVSVSSTDLFARNKSNADYVVVEDCLWKLRPSDGVS